MSERPVRVLLVDDDPLVCQGLRLMLAPVSHVEVVATVHSGEEAVDAVHAYCPDVVLMDVRMHAQDGIETTRQLSRLTRSPRVIVLTTFNLDDLTVRALQAGAAGFLLKTAAPGEIIKAITDVAGGGGAFSQEAAAHVVDHVRADTRSVREQEARAAVGGLSPREREVVVLIARGQTTEGVAEALHMAPATVKTHLRSAQSKLGVESRPELAVLVDRAGLLD